MSDQPLTYETVVDMALRLSRVERARLIAQIAPTLVNDTSTNQPMISLRGLLAGQAPSAEVIDAARQEQWAGFPREDID